MGTGESVAGEPAPELEPGLLATDTLRRAKLLLRRSAQLFGLRVTPDYVECVNCHDRFDVAVTIDNKRGDLLEVVVTRNNQLYKVLMALTPENQAYAVKLSAATALAAACSVALLHETQDYDDDDDDEDDFYGDLRADQAFENMDEPEAPDDFGIVATDEPADEAEFDVVDIWATNYMVDLDLEE